MDLRRYGKKTGCLLQMETKLPAWDCHECEKGLCNCAKGWPCAELIGKVRNFIIF
jgi:hypothetical protein